MTKDEQTRTVTLVARPPAHVIDIDSIDNTFIDTVFRTLSSKNIAGHRVLRVASVRDIDLELSQIVPEGFEGQIRLQIVGHSLAGMLSLGAFWLPASELQSVAFKFPYYVLDTNPAALGLLSKHAGKISEVMLVGCNIGSASSPGYPINGRTLTYTLSELLRCVVLGADDVVGPSEFDAGGWYAPGIDRRPPQGWRWLETAAPVWIECRRRLAAGPPRKWYRRSRSNGGNRPRPTPRSNAGRIDHG